MTLLSDFKTLTGINSTISDAFIINYYLRPAIDKASEVCMNFKETKITLTSGVQLYDLTDESIANPVIADSGVESPVIDGSTYTYLQYAKDYVLQNPTTLFIVDKDLAYNGEIYFKYNEYYSIPQDDPYVETNLPKTLWNAVLRYSHGVYAKESLLNFNNTNGVESKKEDNLSVSYGSINNRRQLIDYNMIHAVKDMKKINGKPLFDYIQVI